MKVRKVEDREGLRGKLVARAEEKARGLVPKGGELDPHITLKTLQLCERDGEWLMDYWEYARRNDGENPTHGINCELGKRICAAVRGEAVGRRKVGSADGVGVVGSYTVLRRRRD